MIYDYDLIVIGGGITGSGVLRDAALRGLHTLLVEKGDFASGTSSKSGKLVHGGLRYLQEAHLKMVFDSCSERRHLWTTVAPHLVQPIPFFFPFYKHSKNPKWLVTIGLFVYDMLSLFRNIQNFKTVSSKELEEKLPILNKTGYTGGLSYWDCACLDSRLVIDTLKSAKKAGAECRNYTRVEQIHLLPCGISVQVRDLIQGKVYSITTKTVVNAAGVWADDILKMAGVPERFNLQITSGIHLLFSNQRFPLKHAIILEAVKDQRPLYVVPWKEYVLVGTTDRFYHGDKDHIVIEKEDVEYLLETINYYFPSLQLAQTDIQSAFAGIRPLIGSNQGIAESKISRDYEIQWDRNGILSITGGKLTTYRLMAKKAVDRLILEFFRDRKLRSCQTLSPISGGDLTPRLSQELHQSYPMIDSAQIRLLLSRYGSNARSILEMIRTFPSKAKWISPDIHLMWAEIDYFIEEEWAVTLCDILMRRSTIFFKHPHISLALLDRIAAYAGEKANWEDSTKAAFMKEYLAYEDQIYH